MPGLDASKLQKSCHVCFPGRDPWRTTECGVDKCSDNKDEEKETGAVAADGDGGAIRVDRLEIENGTLIYRDVAKGTVERIERINARLSAESLQGPFRAKGEVP